MPGMKMIWDQRDQPRAPNDLVIHVSNQVRNSESLTLARKGLLTSSSHVHICIVTSTITSSYIGLEMLSYNRKYQPPQPFISLTLLFEWDHGKRLVVFFRRSLFLKNTRILLYVSTEKKQLNYSLIPQSLGHLTSFSDFIST